MRRLALAIGLALLPVLGFAQAPELAEPGKLTWGASVTFPPFEFQQNDKPSGFDIDLVDALAKKMNLQSSIASIEFKGLIPALLGKRIDAIVSGMYINPQRLEVADMIPYLLVGNQIVWAGQSKAHRRHGLVVRAERAAAPIGTVFENSAKQASASCKAAGKAEINLLSLRGHCELCSGADAGAGGCDHRLYARLSLRWSTRRQAPTRPVVRRSTRIPRSVSRFARTIPV